MEKLNREVVKTDKRNRRFSTLLKQRIYFQHSLIHQSLGVEAVTKKLIRKLPQLPNARIYLDDLFEIENILNEEFAKLSEAPSISFEYEIDDDVVLTTHDELIEHEGHSSNFGLNICSTERLNQETRVLVLYRLVNPQFSVPYQLRERGAQVREKVQQIFVVRADNFRNLAEKVPIYSSIFPPAIAFAVIGTLSFVDRSAATISVFLAILALLCLPLAASMIGGLRHSRIYFRFARQDAKSRKVAWKERIGKLFWLLAGAIIGIAATVLADKFKH